VFQGPCHVFCASFRCSIFVLVSLQGQEPTARWLKQKNTIANTYKLNACFKTTRHSWDIHIAPPPSPPLAHTRMVTLLDSLLLMYG